MKFNNKQISSFDKTDASFSYSQNTKEKIKLYGYIFKQFLKHKKRTIDVIKQEWDQNTWNFFDVEKFPFASLLNKPITNEEGTYQLEDRIIRLSRKDFSEKYENRWKIILNNAVSKDTPIVELGCGVGNKLFFLWKNGYKNLEGYDISENAIKIARKVNEKYGCNISFGVLDITQQIPLFENKVICTFGCLEQLKHYMDSVLTKIYNAKPKAVIHFEFVKKHSTLISRMYVKSRDYQDNLFNILKKWEKENKIIIKNVEPLRIGSPNIPLTFVEWQIISF